LALSVILNTFTPLIVILVAASLLAFLLNYPVSWMERQGAIREQVAILVFLAFIQFYLTRVTPSRPPGTAASNCFARVD